MPPSILLVVGHGQRPPLRDGAGLPRARRVPALRAVHPPPGEPYADQSYRRDCIPASLSQWGNTIASQSAGLQPLLARNYPTEFHILSDLVVDRWAADVEGSSHVDFLFQNDVSTVFGRLIGDKITPIMSIS